MRDRRSGFTLVELIVVTVLGALLISATLQVLITNQRTYTAQNAQIQAQQSVRAAMDILTQELRELSPEGLDIFQMSPVRLRIRASRAFGLICNDTVRGTPTFRVMKFGNWIGATDSVVVFADNQGEIQADDDWITTVVTARDTMETCGSSQAQRLTFANAGSFTTDSVSSGAEVRAFTHYVYRLFLYTDGQYYLGRRANPGTYVPLVGPLPRDNGLQFRYLDANGNETATAANVAQIEITVRTASDVLDSTGEPVRDSVTVRVFTRN
ncbi:MAG: prepilin-type N-terminal cleavage/methylation domain-containing protein [Longimicrobiales bacterium]|nr:prepilin-type N-terminal cleavage/methylation domain-containing protein [Longimicrobiales bacterium]